MASRFEIRPLVGWNRPKTAEPKRAHFRADWNATVDLLTYEVDLLDGSMIALQVDVAEGDIRRDGMLRATARVTGFQGVKVSFDSTHGPLTYATDAFDSWKANVRAVALGLGALRAVDRYGIGTSGEQYRGWTAIADRPAEKTMDVGQAADVLAQWMIPVCRGQDMRTEDQVRRAFRAAVAVHHPDAGGSADAFRLITSARDVLVEAIRAGAR